MPILLLIRHATNDFVKTGRLPGQTSNIHLNEEGRAQADALGRKLEHQKIDAVYSSNLERAIETAWRVASIHRLPIHIRPALADIDNGDFTGRVIKELGEDEQTKEIWKIVVEKPSEAKFPNGEAMIEMQRRVVCALDEIVRAHPDVEEGETTNDDREERREDSESRIQKLNSIRSETVKPEVGMSAIQSETDKSGMTNTVNEKPKRPQTVAVVAHADVIKALVAHFLGMPFDNFQRVGVSPASVSTIVVGEKSVMVMNMNV
jgi:broad specificity phosphatase PhoE